MNMKQLPRLAASFAVIAAVAGAAEAQNVRPLGRTVSEGGVLTIQWPGSGFEARFEGKSFRATIDDYGDNWLSVEVDGVASRIDLDEGVNNYQLFSGEPGLHTIRVTRRTGSLTGPTSFISLKADKLNKTEESARRILVIGDSVASGFGIDGKDQTCAYSYDTHNADLAYPSVLGRTFGADVQTVAVDGHGLIRNYTGEGDTMRTLAWQTIQDDERPWPAASWKPQVVVVNLGTNDFDKGDPGDEFDASYISLLRKVRYAWPEAEIYGSIGGQLYGGIYKSAKFSVFGAVEAVRNAGDKKTHFVEFTPPATGRRYGCDWHPGVDAQKYIAGQLQAAITKDLGWKPAPSPSELIAIGVPAETKPPVSVSLRHRNN
jgi:lysophospholipase L1-like esterase